MNSISCKRRNLLHRVSEPASNSDRQQLAAAADDEHLVCATSLLLLLLPTFSRNPYNSATTFARPAKRASERLAD